MLWKCCIQYASKFGKLSSGHRTRKGQFSFQSQRMIKLLCNCAHSMLVRLWSKSFKLDFTSTWTNMYFDMHKLGLKKAEEPEIKLLTSVDNRERKNSRKISTSASLSMLKPLTVWITNYGGKFLKIKEYQITLPASWETCVQVKKQQLEPDMEQGTCSKLRKSTSRLYIVKLFI